MMRPVKATAAFANLYQQWFDDARELTAVNRRQAQSVRGTHVADVLALWNEGTRSYLVGAPIILRLETCDLAVFPMKSPYIALFFGGVETDEPLATFAVHGAGAFESPRPALRWKSFRPCSFAMGRRLADVGFETSPQGLLLALTLQLDDCGILRIDSRGVGCVLEPSSRSA